MDVADKISVPPVLHDKCDVKLLDESLTCEMNAEVLECALSKCAKEKFRCDCNVYEYVFYFFISKHSKYHSI